MVGYNFLCKTILGDRQIICINNVHLIFRVIPGIAYSIGSWYDKKWISFIEDDSYHFNMKHKLEAKMLLKDYIW
jgi:hypothetical protein